MRDDLGAAEGRMLIEQVARLGRPTLVLAGGEPLVRPDIFDLARHAVARGLPVALATNGTLVDWPAARAVRAAGIRRVRVSLDGAQASTHDRFRRQLGSFHRALEGVAWLRRAGLEVQVDATIAAHNAHELREIYELACGVGAVALRAFLLTPGPRGLETPGAERLDPGRSKAALAELAWLSARGRIPCRAICAPRSPRVLRGRARATGGGGIEAAFVSHAGEGWACGQLPARAGDARQVPLQRIWRHARLPAGLRPAGRLGGKCAACDGKPGCGGCRARALAEAGSVLDRDPSRRFVPDLEARAGLGSSPRTPSRPGPSGAVG
jgi:radical SAM protein with 4Fe4S-binding SPASM domain